MNDLGENVVVSKRRGEWKSEERTRALFVGARARMFGSDDILDKPTPNIQTRWQLSYL